MNAINPSSETFQPSHALDQVLTGLFEEAFSKAGFDTAYATVVPSERPELGAFQCNGALKVAKSVGQPPRKVAETILEAMGQQIWYDRLEVAGPGFINIILSDYALTQTAKRLVEDERLGLLQVDTPRRVIIDFGGPNVAKPMHVGHLRTAVIGECLKRVFRQLGDTVKGDAHFGDWGYQMGLLITALQDERPELPFFDPNAEGPFPTESPVSLSDLERLYPLASARAKADLSYRDKARQATKALQDGHVGYRALWAHFVSVSREALIHDYGALDVSFDWWYGESDADVFIGPMIEDLKAKALLEPDQGAMIVRVTKAEDTRELPPLLVISSEGSSMYGTTDLATICQRMEQFDPELVLYCVDKRQADHLEQVFRASDLAGYIPYFRLEHIANGTVNGTDGKPFKTREGGVLKLGDLIAQAVEKATERLNEAGLGRDLEADAFEKTAHQIAIAAIKFAELINHRLTNYVFDLDRFMSFEGKTGPYLMYQAVRMKSILRKANELSVTSGDIVIKAPAEADLILHLDQFGAVVRETYLKRAPNLLADHVYRLCQNFSKFYAACPVLSATDEHEKSSRLALVGLCLKQVELCLYLMGLSAPERM